MLAQHSSLGGPLHGGVQAVLMELADTRAVQGIARRQQYASGVKGKGYPVLESMAIEYISSPSLTPVLHVQVLSMPTIAKRGSATGRLGRVSLLVDLVRSESSQTISSRAMCHFALLTKEDWNDGRLKPATCSRL